MIYLSEEITIDLRLQLPRHRFTPEDDYWYQTEFTYNGMINITDHGIGLFQ